MPGHSALDSVVQYTIAKYLFFYFNVSPAQFSGLSMPYISDDRKRAHFWSYSWKNSMQVFSCNFLEYNIFTNWFFSSLCSNGWWIHFCFTTYYVLDIHMLNNQWLVSILLLNWVSLNTTTSLVHFVLRSFNEKRVLGLLV